MISAGYEKTLFDSPVSDRLALGQPVLGGSKARRVATREFVLLCDLRWAACKLREVVESKGPLFKVTTRKHLRNALAVEPTKLGAALLNLHIVDQEEMEHYFPSHGFNPYVNLLFRVRRDQVEHVVSNGYWKTVTGVEAENTVARLNAFVDRLRAAAAGVEFKKAMDSFRRLRDKNTKSLNDYINSIFQHRGSRHLVLRLDLGYAMEAAWGFRPTTVTLEQAKRDLAKFQRHLRESLPTTGFAAKLEYGLLRGYHFHVLIFLNGHVVQADVLIAKRLGEHWSNAICEGRGMYWNCNGTDYAERGIGMVNYNDGDKRIALIEKVAAYLTKTDFWLRFSPGGKTFFKGLKPEPPPKRGRPRARAEID